MGWKREIEFWIAADKEAEKEERSNLGKEVLCELEFPTFLSFSCPWVVLSAHRVRQPSRELKGGERTESVQKRGQNREERVCCRARWHSEIWPCGLLIGQVRKERRETRNEGGSG